MPPHLDIKAFHQHCLAIVPVGEGACSFACFDNLTQAEDTGKKGTSLEGLPLPDWTRGSLQSIFLIEVDMEGHSFLGEVA